MENIIVIKIGGVASQHLSETAIKQLKKWQQQGKKLIIVHGGGYAINKLMKEKQVPVQKVNGLRVTSQSDMDLVTYALCDQVGQHLSRQLIKAGLEAVQVEASLSKIVTADFLDKETYGYVGQVQSIQTDYLESMISSDMIPVIPSLGFDSRGQALNINADYLATAMACELSAQRLALMTDVKGVMENGAVLDSLSVGAVQEKIDKGVITGGMIPKIQSAVQTVLAGVGQVMIGDNLTTGTVIEV